MPKHVADLSPKKEDSAEVNNRIVYNLIQDDSRTYCSVDCVCYYSKFSEQLYPVERLNSLSVMFTTTHTKSEK